MNPWRRLARAPHYIQFAAFYRKPLRWLATPIPYPSVVQNQGFTVTLTNNVDVIMELL
jgi:hypothetical protein